MRRPRFLAFGLAMAFAVVAVGAFAQKQEDSDEPRVRRLMIQKRDLLQERVNAFEQSYLIGKAGRAEVFEARAELIRSQLDLAANHSERIEILESQVQLYQAMEQLAESNFKTGDTTRPEVLKARVNRIDAEVELLLEKRD